MPRFALRRHPWPQDVVLLEAIVFGSQNCRSSDVALRTGKPEAGQEGSVLQVERSATRSDRTRIPQTRRNGSVEIF